MLGQAANQVRRYGLRLGLVGWWYSLSQRNRTVLAARFVFESALLFLWVTLLLTWSVRVWGSEGVFDTLSFAWVLILWLPVFHVVRNRWFWLALSWLVGVQGWPTPRFSGWRPFWLASLGGFLYLSIQFRPWGLLPALFLAGCSVMMYLLLHVGGNFGTEIPVEEIAVSQRPHPIGFFVLGFEAMPGLLKVLPASPLIWVLTAPLLWYVGSWTWYRVLSSSVYWLAGLGTLVYWLLWAAIKWRRYGNLITVYGDVVVVVPARGLRPGSVEATVSISRIASGVGKSLLGVYLEYDPGLQFPNGDRYRARGVRLSFVEEVNKRRKAG